MRRIRKFNPTQSPAFGRFAVTVVALLVALFSAAAMLPESLNHYASFSVASDDGVTARYLFDRPRQMAACKASLSEVLAVVRELCKGCQLDRGRCADNLSEQEIHALGDAPLAVPSARIPGGTVLFEGPPELTAQACQLAARNSTLLNGVPTVHCYAAGESRPQAFNPTHLIDPAETRTATIATLGALIVSWLICLLLIRYQHLHARFSLDATDGGPQKMHARPTPRIGGVPVILALMTAAASVASFGRPSLELEFGWFLLAALPAFAGGISEDLTKRIGVVLRLLATMLSGAVGAWLLGGTLQRMDTPGIDLLLAWAPFAVIATLVAVGGLANAINIIDGYNGLAAGYSILAALAFAWVSAAVGDSLLMTASLALAAGLAGFLFWNFPRGRIFLGDGGAYLVGFWLAEIGVLLTVRNSEVSAWFVMAVLAYPVTETLFSIYRRKLVRQASPGQPDRLHFHQLFYHRAIRFAVGSSDPDAKTARNGKVAPWIWAFNLPPIVGACAAWYSDAWCLALCLVFFGLYVWTYLRLARFSTPRFIGCRASPMARASRKG